MSETENIERCVADVREIERATERLERTLERAREAVRRANRPTPSQPGDDGAVPGADYIAVHSSAGPTAAAKPTGLPRVSTPRPAKRV